MTDIAFVSYAKHWKQVSKLSRILIIMGKQDIYLLRDAKI